MKRIFICFYFTSVLLTMMVAFLPKAAFAKCYNFRDGGDYQVCVKGDSFDDRKKAMEICKKAKGSDCGAVTSYSSSCHSNSNKCYDENGNNHRDLSGY
ncbi:MAG: hypothetical protein JW982_01645 [Spirochaetes bacterium]|nr:hypothetical protein [Spirochaetota bacterium]